MQLDQTGEKLFILDSSNNQIIMLPKSCAYTSMYQWIEHFVE